VYALVAIGMQVLASHALQLRHISVVKGRQTSRV